MQFIDDEFLLLSRGGRVSAGTNARLGRPRSSQQEARQELAARERARRERQPRRFRTVLPRAAAVAAVRGPKRSGQQGRR